MVSKVIKSISPHREELREKKKLSKNAFHK